jgi:hypothetical protein
LKREKQKGMKKLKQKGKQKKTIKTVLLQNGLLGQEYVLGRRNGRKHRKIKKRIEKDEHYLFF